MIFDKNLMLKPSYCNEQPGYLEIKSDGTGITDLVVAYLMWARLDQKLVEITMGIALASLFPYKKITGIRAFYSAKDNETPKWEIYLKQERNKYRPLSDFDLDVHRAVADLALKYLDLDLVNEVEE